MTMSFATFERLKDKGVAAFKAGDYVVARTYLLDASECVIELAEKARSDETRRQHEELAVEIMELAKECERRRNPRDRNRTPQREADGDNRTDASEWIMREKPDIGFDDIAGLEDIKEDIRLKMIYPASFPELAQKYGISMGGGLLLYGPPGTGKTMMAKAIAKELEATFFVISPAQVLSKWVGEAEQNIRQLFDAAKQEDSAIIFMDEVEALVPMRSDDSSSVMQRVVPQILQELEGVDTDTDRALLFVGATNKPWALDDAMLRPGRLDTKAYVGLPDGPARFRLLEIYFAPKPLDEDVDFGDLCDRLDGYTGADIKNIAGRSASIPFTEAISGRAPRPIGMLDIESVINVTPPSVSPSMLARFDVFAGATTAEPS
jgi:SpoVK/Ycf46/Vps4 family AAA+-type ATPase